MAALAAQLRGRLREQVVLAKRCWFQVGGPADWLFVPEDADDLAVFLQQRPAELPYFVLGVGSNLLVRDGGIEGVVVRLGRGFAGMKREDGDRIRVGAAALDLNLAQFALEQSIGGLEFLSGIPGTIGGALAMNAGAYGRETKDVLVEAVALDPDGHRHHLQPEQIGFSYRHSGLPEGWIFTEAVLQGEETASEVIITRMEKIAEDRQQAQPIKARTGGSTFTNPVGHKAWQLVDEAGCRGLRIGGAQVSEKHTNFLLNHGAASAADIEALGEEVRRRVKLASGVELQWEIKRIGRALAGIHVEGTL
ncbi:MAG: UDP-N-acetylmuramate dehydrogenase [Rickettsiales bacterium]|nr:UDP-N-acetylmuramate dehydrogenase [Rickettsiales bacterium]